MAKKRVNGTGNDTKRCSATTVWVLSLNYLIAKYITRKKVLHRVGLLLSPVLAF